MCAEKSSKSPWIERAEAKQRAKDTKKHEQRIAKEFGGVRLAGSGNVPMTRESKIVASSKFPRMSDDMKSGCTWHDRDALITRGGDVQSARFLIEHKRTKAKSFSVTIDTLKKVELGAQRASREPLLIVLLERTGDEYAVIHTATLKRLLEDLGEKP